MKKNTCYGLLRSSSDDLVLHEVLGFSFFHTKPKLVSIGEGKRLLPHLLKFTSGHREEGMAIQKELADFEFELNAAVEEIWVMAIPIDGDGQTQPLPDSWATRMEEVQRQRRINPVERVAKPQTDGETGDWKMKLLELVQ